MESASAPKWGHAAPRPTDGSPSLSPTSRRTRYGKTIANWPPSTGFVPVGRPRYFRIRAWFSAHSRCIREPCGRRRRPKPPSSKWRLALPASRSSASTPKTAFISWPTMMRSPGFPTARLLKDRLAQAVLYAERYDRWATVVFIDLDNFKIVNDSLGHNAGDELLKIVARSHGPLRKGDRHRGAARRRRVRDPSFRSTEERRSHLRGAAELSAPPSRSRSASTGAIFR